MGSIYKMTNPKILIVDDDVGIRSQLKWGIEGYDIVTADSRLNAMEQINIHHPLIVTLDLGLPPDADGTTEGFATLKEILQKAPATKVVMVSASEDAGNAERAKSYGAFDYYSKPVDMAQLLRTINRAYAEIQDVFHKK